MLASKRLFFLGAGSMAEAMIKGLLSAELLEAQQITVSSRKRVERLTALNTTYGVRACEEKLSELAAADIIILAMKPFDLVAALEEVNSAITPPQLIISLAAGVSTAMISSCLAVHVPVIRAMPNTSSFVQASATAITNGRWASDAHLELAQILFSAIGTSVVVQEELMDAVTGLSGSGPAYFYYVFESLLEAGIACGLPDDTARTLLLQTVYGAAKMLKETGKSPSELRRQVTSPNGTTMAGITVLEEGNGKQLLINTVKRATQRSQELGREANILPVTRN